MSCKGVAERFFAQFARPFVRRSDEARSGSASGAVERGATCRAARVPRYADAGGARSSAGQSSGLIIRWSQVRVLAGPLEKSCKPRAGVREGDLVERFGRAGLQSFTGGTLETSVDYADLRRLLRAVHRRRRSRHRRLLRLARRCRQGDPARHRARLPARGPVHAAGARLARAGNRSGLESRTTSGRPSGHIPEHSRKRRFRRRTAPKSRRSLPTEDVRAILVAVPGCAGSAGCSRTGEAAEGARGAPPPGRSPTTGRS